MDLLERLKQARHEHTEAKIKRQQLEEETTDREIFHKLSVDWKSLGSNESAREIAFQGILRNDTYYQDRLTDLKAAREKELRWATNLETVLDERREEENRTWAILASYLVGRVDHIGHAPVQAVKDAIKHGVRQQVVASPGSNASGVLQEVS